MGSTLLTALLALAASGTALAADPPDATCPDRGGRLDLVDAAEKALVEADLDGAEQRLRELEAALGCGAIADRDLLARMWLVEGAWLTLSDQAADAVASWQAAARVAPDVWVPAYGDMLRKAYEEAAAQRHPTATTPLSVDPALFRWVGAVDGEPVQRFPLDVEPGLHLVQVGATEDDVRFARLVMAFPDTPVVVVTGLVEPTTEVPAPQPEAQPAPEPEPPPAPVEHAPLSLHVGAGAAIGIGRPSEDSDEPPLKVVVPVETGVVIRPTNALWLRPAFRAGPLLTGAYAYEDAWGPTTSPTSLGFDLSGGLAGRQGDLGLLVGYHFPERVAFRGTVSVVTGKFPARVEGRLGLDVPAGTAPETAFDVLLAIDPRLVRHRPDFGADEAGAE